ncbi:serine hydrolase [Pseudaestuariivita sp.]|uniref:serine hydrolase n=1 Tax=Pseudaestuariivita sp. TaxID=2211669 RepID=UPI0040590FA9
MRWTLVFAFLTVGQSVQADAPQSIRLLFEDGASEVWTESEATLDSTPFAIASVGKTMTAVAVLRYVDRGLLGLETPIVDTLPDRVLELLPDVEGITLRHLLNMTSGLPDYYDAWFVEQSLRRPDQVSALLALDVLRNEGLLFQPGLRFNYSNTNYVLLGLILESAAGQTYRDIIEAEVFAPAGMRDAVVFGGRPLPDGFPKGHESGTHITDYFTAPGMGDGGVLASARDVVAFYTALFVDQTLLSSDALATLTEDANEDSYGLGIDIDGAILGHSGGDLGFSSDVRINVETGAIAVELTAEGSADLGWAFEAVE